MSRMRRNMGELRRKTAMTGFRQRVCRTALWALLGGLALPAVMTAQAQEAEPADPVVKPASEGSAELPNRSEGPESIRPDEPVDLTLELLVGENDSVASTVFAKREMKKPEPISAAQLDAINPHSKEEEIAIPLRGYPAPDQAPAPNRPLYAEASLGLHLTTGLRAGLSGDTWPFDYHASLEYESTNGFVENGDRSGFSIEAGGGYVIGLDYGIFGGGYMGADARFSTETYRLYALEEAPERSHLAWGVDATGTASYAGIDFEGVGRLARTSLSDQVVTEATVVDPVADQLDETSVEGSLTGEMKAIGLGWQGLLDMRLTNTSQGSANYGAVGLSAVLDVSIFSLRGGGKLTLAGATEGENFTRFSPEAELRVHPFNGVVLSGSLSGGLRPTTVRNLAELNPYLALDGEFLPEDERVGYEVALHLEPGRSWGLRVGASRRSFDNYLFFDAPESGRFAPMYDKADVDLINGDFYWELDSRNELLVLTRYTVGSVGDSTGDLPYMPKWDAEVGYSRRLLSSPITLGGTLRYIGERTGGTETLDPAFLVGVEGSYTVVRYLDLVVEARNLLNREYELWDGYRERGFYLGIGARGRF